MAKTTMKDLANLKLAYEKKLRESGQEIMKEAVAEFFAANPKVKAVVWTQYTPYFNDGDVCSFGVNEPHFTFEEVDPHNVEKYPEEAEGFFSRVPKRYTEKALAGQDWAKRHNAHVDALEAEHGKAIFEQMEKAIESFHNTIGAAPEDLFEAAFGDHVQVVLTTKEITINDIDHD